MTFELFGFDPVSKELVRLWPAADDDTLAPDFPRTEAKQRVEAKFRELIANPGNRDYSIVVVSPTIGGQIVAVEYPGPIPAQIAEKHDRESRWLKWILDPASDTPEAGPTVQR